MERLVLPLALLRKALQSLESALKVVKDAQETQNPNLVLAAEDSIIQRFEYCFDSFWKFLKKYLEALYDEEDVNTPKKVIRACVKKELFTEAEGGILIDMTDDRNETSHNYDIETVRLILPDIPKYYLLMVSIVHRLENKQIINRN